MFRTLQQKHLIKCKNDLKNKEHTMIFPYEWVSNFLFLQYFWEHTTYVCVWVLMFRWFRKMFRLSLNWLNTPIYLRFCKAKGLDAGVFISLKGRNIKYGNLTSPFIGQRSCSILNLVTLSIDFSISLLFNDHKTYVIFTNHQASILDFFRK